MKISLPHTLVSLLQGQTRKLSETCETESASVMNPVGSEKIYIYIDPIHRRQVHTCSQRGCFIKQKNVRIVACLL